MNTKTLMNTTTPLCLSESWVRDLTILSDRPLSAAFWNLAPMTGEEFLDDLPELQVDRSQLQLAYS